MPSARDESNQLKAAYGAAMRPEQLADPKLRTLVASEYGRLTPEIHLKWNSLEWRPGEFNYVPVDQLLGFCTENGMSLRGHTLLWERSTPAWAIKEIETKRDWATVAGHFHRTLKRYGGKIQDWDVVNEPIDTETGDDQGLRLNVFRRTFGPNYAKLAFDEARQGAPNGRLFVNDYGFEYDNPIDGRRRHAFLKFLDGLQRDGAPLNGVGLQAHLDLAKGPLAARQIREFVRSISAMGLTIDVTELDVKERAFAAPVSERDHAVADEVRRFLDIVLAEHAIRTVTTWGVSDRYSWLSEGDGNGGPAAAGEVLPLNRGLPFDTAYQPKPFFYELRQALDSGLSPSVLANTARDRPRHI